MEDNWKEPLETEETAEVRLSRGCFFSLPLFWMAVIIIIGLIILR